MSQKRIKFYSDCMKTLLEMSQEVLSNPHVTLTENQGHGTAEFSSDNLHTKFKINHFIIVLLEASNIQVVFQRSL